MPGGEGSVFSAPWAALALSSFIAEAGLEVKTSLLLGLPSAEITGVSAVDEVLSSFWILLLVSPH